MTSVVPSSRLTSPILSRTGLFSFSARRRSSSWTPDPVRHESGIVREGRFAAEINSLERFVQLFSLQPVEAQLVTAVDAADLVDEPPAIGRERAFSQGLPATIIFGRDGLLFLRARRRRCQEKE